MAQLYFKVGADYQNVIKLREEIQKLEAVLKGFSTNTPVVEIRRVEQQLASAKNKLRETTKEASEAGASLKDTFSELGKPLAMIGGVVAIKEFLGQVVRIRGEFQEIETSIETLVGTQMKNKLIPQIKELAKVSPLTMQDIVGAEKMMLGFNIEADKTIGFLKALSDVSMGSSAKFNSLTLAFSQMSASGKLMGQDLNQMINSGFNPLQQISISTGKSIATLKEEMSKGAISAEMVQQAFIDATSAGGKFYKMSENASKTINGQLSMLEDAMDSAFNEIGTKSESLIMGAIQSVTGLIENYETIGRVLASLIATYGAYKTAVLVATAVDTARLTVVRATALGVKTNTAGVIAHTIATKAATIAQATFNKVANMNPYVLLASAVVGLTTAIWAYTSSIDKAKEAEEDYQKRKDNIIKAENEHKQQIEDLISVAEDDAVSTDLRKKALFELASQYKDVFKKYKTEEDMLANILQIKKEIADIDAKKSMQNTANELDYVDQRIKQLEQLSKTQKYTQYNTLTDGTITSVEMYGLRPEEQQELEHLRKKKGELQVTRRKELSDAYFANLTGISNDELEQEIKRRKNLLAKIELDKADKGEIKAGRVYNLGVFKKEELEAQLMFLEQEQNKRNAERKTSENWLKQYKAEMDKAQKAYDAFMQDKSTKLSETEWEEKRKKLESELQSVKDKYEKRAGKSASKKNTQAKKEQEQRLDAEEKLGDQLLKLIQKNAEDEVSVMEESKDKKLKVLELDFAERKSEIAKQAKEFAELNKKAGVSGLNGQGLTTEQSKAISEALAQNEAKYQHSKAELEKQYENERIEALYNYLSKYGDVQQQIYAITTYYNHKIAQEKDAYNQASLAMERDNAIKNIQANEQRKDIDWSSMFGNIELYSVEKLQSIKEEIRRVLAEDSSLEVSDRKNLIEQYNRISDAISNATFNLAEFFGFKSEEADKLRVLQEEYELRKQIVEQLQQQQELARGQYATDKKALDSFLVGAGVVNANADYSNVSNQLRGNDLSTFNSLFAQFQKSGAELTQLNGEVADASQAMNNAGELAQGAGAKFASAFATTDKIIHTVNDNIQSTADFMKEIGRENTTAGKFISSFAESSQYAVNAFDSFKKGDLMGVVTNIHGALRTLGDSLGILGIKGFGSSDISLHDDMVRLAEQNEALSNAMETLSDDLKNANFSESVEIYQRQLEYFEQSQRNTAELMERSAKAYSSGFLGIGGKKSSASKVTEGLSLAEWQRISSIVDKTIDSGTEFFSLTASEMADIAKYAPDLYAKIKALADDGAENASQYMDDYIAYEEQLQKLQDEYGEKMTDTSFDSFRDEFKNALTDMEMSAEDFAKSFENLLVNSIAESLMTQKYDKRIKELYDKWVGYAEGGFTKDEIDDLKKDKDALYSDIEAEREFLDFARSGASSQNATSEGLQSLTQEQGEKLEGRFTALQLAGERISDENVLQTQELTLLNATTADLLRISQGTNNALNGIADQIAMSYLELQEINENGANTVKYLKDIKADIAEVKNNTSNLV